MRNYLCCLGIILSCIGPCFAQKYDYQWIHGVYYTGSGESNFIVDFNTFPPLVRSVNSKFLGHKTTVSISDDTGSFLFYSNGCQIFDHDSNVVEGGEDVLNSNYYCKTLSTAGIAQGAFALPGIFNEDNYFQFGQEYKYPANNNPNDCNFYRLLAHTLDMAANQGSGKVTEKNQLLMEGCFQVASANRHANGRDWWLLVGDNREQKFYRWLLTPSGIEGPWTQEIANPTLDGYWFCGWTEFSPDGEQYIINACRTGAALYDFDRCTGLLSGPTFLSRTTTGSTWWNYGAAFSPDGRFLYTTDGGSKRLWQYDLTASDIEGSKEVVALFDNFVDTTQRPTLFTYFQNGPDGKLYIWAGDSYYMHIIHWPNRKGVDCQMEQRAIQLPKMAFAANIYYPHYRLGPLDNSSCDTLGLNNLPHAEYRYDLSDSTQALALQFTDVSWYEPTVWHWDFGDPASGSSNASTEQNPVHTFSKSGTYEVCLIASNQYAADTICKQVKVGISSAYTLPALPQAQVLPNPVTDLLSIRLPALLPGHPLLFALSDAYGRTVREAGISDFETTVDVAGLPAGMYFWRVSVRGEVLQAGKIIKTQ